MPEGTRNDSYSAALNTAIMELTQISEELEFLQHRKGSLQMASEGLKALLATGEQPIPADRRSHSSPLPTVPRVAEFPAAEGLSSNEFRHEGSFPQTAHESADPLQQRIHNALLTASHV